MNKKECILGVDPGSNFMGYAIILSDGSNNDIVDSGVAKFNKEENHLEKIKGITLFTDNLIKKYEPAILSIEDPFYGKNVQSMLKLSRAQGAVISCALRANMQVFEYTPRRVKQSITGRGNASKDQVAAIVASITGINAMKNEYDMSDAIAIALCHIFSKGKTIIKKAPSKKKGSWDNFIKDNPNRIT